MNKINLSIIGSRGYPYVYSGYETFVKELSERLIDKNYSVKIYCHSKLFKKKPKRLNGIELIYTPSLTNKYFSQIFNSFFSFLHACFSNADIILVVNTANGIFGILTKIFRKKTVINVDGLEWKRPKWKGFGRYYFLISTKLAIIFYDQLVTDSEEMKKIYQKKFNKNSTCIAYGETPKTSNKKKLIEKFNLKKRGFYLIVGRLIPDNNSDLIIKEFIKTETDKKLVIVGDVPYYDKFANDVKKIKDSRLLFTGYIKDQHLLNEMYHNCYAYIHGHEFGGTNPTMINALACSTAILALETKFNEEMLQNYKYGMSFTKENNSLKELINYGEDNNSVMNNYRSKSQMGITEKYNWEKIVDQYSNLFKKTIAN